MRALPKLPSLTGFCSRRVPAGFYRAEGIIKNVNTIEDYKNLDRAQVIDRAGRIVSSRQSQPRMERSY